MPFVKLDTGILNSTLWIEREAREVFITALLMAEPYEVTQDLPQICTKSLDYTGFVVPKGWYGFVHAAGSGIIRRALVPLEEGLAALDKLSQPDLESRSKDFEGRRLVRVDGGFVVLNYMKYRDRDYTAAERQRRLRARRKADSHAVTASNNAVTVTKNVTSSATVTHSREQKADIAEKQIYTEGEIPYSSEEKSPSPPNGKGKYTQNDHDEKHLRLIAAAEKKISQSLQASIGRDTTITEQQFVVMVCQEVGITVERYFELKEKQKKWPSQITVL